MLKLSGVRKSKVKGLNILMTAHAVMLPTCIRKARGSNPYCDTASFIGFLTVLLKEHYLSVMSYKIHFHQVTWIRVVIFRILHFIPGGNHLYERNTMLEGSKTSPENSKEGRILPVLGNRPLSSLSNPQQCQYTD